MGISVAHRALSTGQLTSCRNAGGRTDVISSRCCSCTWLFSLCIKFHVYVTAHMTDTWKEWDYEALSNDLRGFFNSYGHICVRQTVTLSCETYKILFYWYISDECFPIWNLSLEVIPHLSLSSFRVKNMSLVFPLRWKHASLWVSA